MFLSDEVKNTIQKVSASVAAVMDVDIMVKKRGWTQSEAANLTHNLCLEQSEGNEYEMIIEKGRMSDVDELEQLYDDVTDDLDAHVNYPGWKKGIYPCRQDAILGIEEDGLYVVRDGTRMVGSFLLRHEQEAAYSKADWTVSLEDQHIFVIHTFAVHPQYQKKGIGKEVLHFIVEQGKKENVKAIRLDVYKKNLPAISLYQKFGFQYIDTVDLGYGEYGLDQFELYQLLL